MSICNKDFIKENIHESLLNLVGNTPLVKLRGYCKQNGIKAEIVAKLEYFNPLGSVKDRVGVKLIEEAEKLNLINSESVIIEPTSGNTGIGLAFTCSIKGYKLILTMPENMSKERILLLKSLGAEIILTPAEKGMTGAIEKANELSQLYQNSYIPSQFTNSANVSTHISSTGPEILRDTGGKIDYFVAGVGTGGTITGVATVLKKHNDDIKIIAVEPSSSPVLSGGLKGSHGLMGIGAGFIPDILDTQIIDEIITVSEEEAYKEARTLAVTDGILTGISSGAALCAAKKTALKNNSEKVRVVVLLPDSGERYLSTPLFDCL